MMARWRALVLQMGGSATAALYVLHRLLQRLGGGRMGVFPYRVVAQPIANPALRAVRNDAHTLVRRVDASDPVTASFPRPAKVVQQRFLNGDQCYVAWVKGQFAGHIWIARQRYTEDEVRGLYLLNEPEAVVWDYDVYVAPAFRATRTLARLWKFVDETLAAQGVHWTASRINRFNAESLRSHARLGAVALGYITVLRLGAAEFNFIAGSGLQRSAGASRWQRFTVDVQVRLTAPVA